MKRIVVQEHTKIVRREEGAPFSPSPDIEWLEPRLYERLKRFDQRGRAEKDQVFSWSDGSTRTTQWVGVIQVPGLQVEVLPKIDEADLNGKDEKQIQARSNFALHALCRRSSAGAGARCCTPGKSQGLAL